MKIPNFSRFSSHITTARICAFSKKFAPQKVVELGYFSKVAVPFFGSDFKLSEIVFKTIEILV